MGASTRLPPRPLERPPPRPITCQLAVIPKAASKFPAHYLNSRIFFLYAVSPFPQSIALLLPSISLVACSSGDRARPSHLTSYTARCLAGPKSPTSQQVLAIAPSLTGMLSPAPHSHPSTQSCHCPSHLRSVNLAQKTKSKHLSWLHSLPHQECTPHSALKSQKSGSRRLISCACYLRHATMKLAFSQLHSKYQDSPGGICYSCLKAATLTVSNSRTYSGIRRTM